MLRVCFRVSVTLLALAGHLPAQTPAVSNQPKRPAASGARRKPAPTPKPSPDTKPGNYFVEVYTLKPVVTPPSPGASECGELLPRENSPISANQLIDLLGTQPGWTLKPLGHRVLIFADKPLDPNLAKDRDQLSTLRKQMDQISQISRFSVEIAIPHSAVLGDAVAKAAALKYGGLDIEPVGPGKIRVSGDSAPDCTAWTAFLRDIRDLAWRPYPVSPVAKLFYLDGADVSTALNNSGTVATMGEAADKTPASSGSDSSSAGGNSAGAGKPAEAESTDSTKAAGKSSGSAGIAKSSGSTSKAGDSSEEAGQSSSSNTGKKNQDKGSAAASAKQANAAPAPAPPGTSGPDMLIVSEPNPGDDSAVDEKRRVIAMLDLPRPEMLVNIWTEQISSDHSDEVRLQSNNLHQSVNAFNKSLQNAILTGWEYVWNQAVPVAKFYDKSFYQYLAYKTVAELKDDYVPSRDSLPVEPAEQAIDRFLSRSGTDEKVPEDVRQRWGLCPADKYCLGYTELFHPLKPRLTDLLISVIAARDPVPVINTALNKMEGRDDTPVATPSEACEQTDADQFAKYGPKPQFECFRRIALSVLSADPGEAKPYGLGLLRSAIANFLFNWKMANQFPHEFSAYDLDQSAQTLNTALRPLIDAFNRDIAAYQTFLQEEFTESVPKQARNKAFYNSAIVTVRTVSGKETLVDTTTQSYLDVSEPPTLAELASSISQAGSGTLPKGIPSNITADAVVGALNAMQTSEAKIGRGVSVDIKPRALAGADSAEIDVKLNVEESAEPALYTGGKTSDKPDDTSRIAKHNTTTKMRIDSLKLFEVSSLSARLQRSRTRIPLIPPLVELPYIGSIVNLPRKPATEYHSSVAVLSAVVVPTAADLAFGTRYEPDRVVVKGCTSQSLGCVFRTARAFQDLGRPTGIRGFNRAITACFATGLVSAVPLWQDPTKAPPLVDCDNLTLHDIPRESE
jgi:hypothetical protein